MFKRLKTLFDNLNLSPNSQKDIEDPRDTKFAVAILLTEVMYADSRLDQQEQDMIIRLLQQQFALDESEAMAIFNRANEKMKDAVSLYKYTSLLNSALTYQEKQTFMINLWKVVFADGQVDKYEEHLIRRVADLIHIRHMDFIKARYIAEASA